MDQDEVLFDLISKYTLEAVEREDAFRQSRVSVNVTSINKEETIFSLFSSFFKSNLNSHLSFRKIIYLPKEVEIKSMAGSPRRAKYVIDELFARLKKGEIPLLPDDLAEACYLWLGLNSLEQVQPNSIGQLIALVSNNVIPE